MYILKKLSLFSSNTNVDGHQLNTIPSSGIFMSLQNKKKGHFLSGLKLGMYDHYVTCTVELGYVAGLWVCQKALR